MMYLLRRPSVCTPGTARRAERAAQGDEEGKGKGEGVEGRGAGSIIADYSRVRVLDLSLHIYLTRP